MSEWISVKDGLPEFSDWQNQIVKEIKKYPHIKNKWREARFKKMYKDGLSASEAFRCWFCAH